MDEAQDHDELLLQPASPVAKVRPKALWAALAAVVVAVGALAVTNLGGDGSATPPIPISLLNAGGARVEAAADSSFARVRYEAGPDLPALGGTGPVYRLRTVTEADVRHLADVLGVAGDPGHDAGHWTIQDGAGLLNVNASGGAWWFNGAAVVDDQATSSSGASAGCGPGADCAVASCASGADCEQVTTTTYDPCTTEPVAPNVDCFGTPSVPPDSGPGSTDGNGSSPPATPIPDTLPPDSAPCAKVVSTDCGTAPDPDLPSKAEARELVLDLLGRAGTATSGAVVTVDGGVGTWAVSVEPMLNGRPSGLVARGLVGPHGEIQGANGFLTEPEEIGTYPVLTTHATIERANRTTGGSPATGVASDVAAREDAVDTGGAVVDEPATGGAPAATTSVPGCKSQPTGIDVCEQIAPDDPTVATGDPGGTGEICEPTNDPICTGSGSPGTTIPIEASSVVLVDAVPTLMMIGATDGSTDLYLVPAYRFTPEGGGQIDLVSLSDEAIASPPTTTDTTVPTPDGSVEPPVTTPSDCELLVEGDDTGTTHTIQTCPPPGPRVTGEPIDPDAPVTSATGTPETATTLVAEP